MKEWEYLETLIGQYLTANPGAENPLAGFNYYGMEGLIALLEKANGRLITFEFDPKALDKNPAYIEGKIFNFVS